MPDDMKPLPAGCDARVVAVIRAVGLDAVMERLLVLTPSNVGIEQVRGYGRQKGHLEFYDEGGLEGGFLPKVRLEFTVPADTLAPALEAVCEGARTGRIGDGKIFVHAVEAPVSQEPASP